MHNTITLFNLINNPVGDLYNSEWFRVLFIVVVHITELEMQCTDFIHHGSIKLEPCPSPDHKSSGLRKRVMHRPLSEENIHGQGTLSAKRIRLITAPELNNTPAHLRRKSVGGKGMFLHQMQRAGLRVPEFQCVTTEMVAAIEQHPLDTHRLSAYI